MTSALYGVFLTLLLFVVVVLHELGHAVAAQHYGIEVYDIVLLPIGGVARLSEMPEKPSQELVVALAGPAVNLALSLLLLPIMVGIVALDTFSGVRWAWPAISEPGWLNLAAFMFMVNLSLLVFNMLPAFPMDGGRVLRALIALRWSHRRATLIAVTVGRIFAVGFGALAIYTGNIFLGMVALFVFSGAGAEGRSEVETEAALPFDISASRPPVLLSNMPAYLAFDRLMRSPYQALAVVNDRGDFVGLVTRTGMESRWAAGVRGPVSLFVEPDAPMQR
jgi:Zn-dependent protease